MRESESREREREREIEMKGALCFSQIIGCAHVKKGGGRARFPL